MTTSGSNTTLTTTKDPSIAPKAENSTLTLSFDAPKNETALANSKMPSEPIANSTVDSNVNSTIEAATGNQTDPVAPKPEPPKLVYVMKKTFPPQFSGLSPSEIPLGDKYANFSLFYTKESNHKPLPKFVLDTDRPCMMSDELNSVSSTYPAENQLYGCSYLRN